MIMVVLALATIGLMRFQRENPRTWYEIIPRAPDRPNFRIASKPNYETHSTALKEKFREQKPLQMMRKEGAIYLLV